MYSGCEPTCSRRIPAHPCRLALDRARSSQIPVSRCHRATLVVERRTTFIFLLSSASSGQRDSSSEIACGGSSIEPKNNGSNQNAKAFHSINFSAASEITPERG